MYIDYKAEVWFRIEIQDEQTLDNCKDHLSGGGTVFQLFDKFDDKIIGCGMVDETEKVLSPKENKGRPTIRIHGDEDEIIWENKE